MNRSLVSEPDVLGKQTEKRKVAVRVRFIGTATEEAITNGDGESVKSIGRRNVVTVEKLVVTAGSTEKDRLRQFAWQGPTGTGMTIMAGFDGHSEEK